MSWTSFFSTLKKKETKPKSNENSFTKVLIKIILIINLVQRTFIMSCNEDMLPRLVGSGEGDVSEGRGKAGGKSRGRGGAARLAPL